MEVKYEAGPQHTLIADGVEIKGGKTAELPDAVAKRLLADPQISVSAVETEAPKTNKPKAKSAGQETPKE